MQALKLWLDRLLVADVFLVIGGALWFLSAVICEARGLHQPLALFQTLWDPLFMPAIGCRTYPPELHSCWPMQLQRHLLPSLMVCTSIRFLNCFIHGV